MAFAGMNYFAVLIAALAAYAWGTLYYMTLAKQWLAAVELTEIKRSAAPFVISFIALLVMAFVLAGSIGHLGPGNVSIRSGIISGLIIWAGFVATTIFVNNAYPGRKYMLSVMESVHWLAELVIQDAVIGAMGV